MGQQPILAYSDRPWGRGRETSAFEMVLAPFPKITLGLILPIHPKCEISLNLSNTSCKIEESVVYYFGQQPSAVKVGHTSRGDSGALYLQSATAGVESTLES